MAKGFPITKSLPIVSEILPFFGYIDECCHLMLRLSHKSRRIWTEDEQVLIRIIKKRRTITLHSFNDSILKLINFKILKYFNLNVESIEVFITSLLNRLLQERENTLGALYDQAWRLQTLSEELQLLSSSISSFPLPEYIIINHNHISTGSLEDLSNFIEEYRRKQMESVCITSEDRMLITDSASIPFVPSFSLMNNTELAHFYNHERKQFLLDIAYDLESKRQELNKPFIEHIGVLKINVEWDKFLKKFFSICDTKIDSIEILNSLKIDGDMFADNDDLSKVLKQSVTSILTNKSFENTCHRFSNVENLEVQNFPAMNNLLTARIQKMKKIEYIAETFSSAITITNSFITTNGAQCEPLYWEKLTAHFSNEDVALSDDWRYLYIGGNMISISGISFPKLPENLSELINQGKDAGKGVDRIVVLLDNEANFPVVSFARRILRLPRQSIQAKANLKYIDLKIKKVNIEIKINSSWDQLKIQKPSNEPFIMGLKLLINGKGNLASPKLGFWIKNQIVEFLCFEAQKYADAAKLLDNLSNVMPSAIQTLCIVIAQSNSGIAAEKAEEKASVTTKLCEMKNKYPKLEVILKDLNYEDPLVLYHSQIMNSRLHFEKSL